MKITCPNCNTSYEVKATALGLKGRSVKCARCGERWQAVPTEEDMKEEARNEAEQDAAENDQNAEDDAPDQEVSETTDEAADEDDWAEAIGAADEPAGEFANTVDGEIENAESESEAVPPSTIAAEQDVAYAGARPAIDQSPEGFDDPPPIEKPADIESQAKRPKIRVRKKKIKRARGKSLTRFLPKISQRRMTGAAIFLTSIAACVLVVTLRTPIVQRFPELAGLYQLAGLNVNLRGLEFRDLRIFREVESGAVILVIEGSIENVSHQAVFVPALRFSLRSEDAQEIYAWVVELKTHRLDVNRTTRFRTRLVSPPEMAKDVQVRFIERKNKQVQLQ